MLAQSLAVLCEYMLLTRVPAQRDVLTGNVSSYPTHQFISLGTRPSENRKEGLGDRPGSKCTERNVWNL